MTPGAAAQCSLSAVEFRNHESIVLVTDEHRKYTEVRFVVRYHYFYNLFRVSCESDFFHCVYTALPSERLDCILVTEMEQ